MATASEPSDKSPAVGEDTDLLGAFIRAVSHDMRSPLLALSMSTELLADAFATDERAQMAREGLIQGIAELERLLDAVSGISRARTRILASQPLLLRDLLAGHIFSRDDAWAKDAQVAVDPRGVNEVIAALGIDSSEIRVALSEGSVELSLPLPKEVPAVGVDPLRALLTSLQEYAGSAVAVLAASQVQLERQGGALRCEDGSAVLRLPLVT